MAIEVIGAGLGRTGTTSLKAALEELGFDPCYEDLFGHPEHVQLWEAAARGKSVDWNELFGGYRVATDWPVCLFYEELMHSYPDAKVILTLRPQQMVREHLQYPLSQTKDSLLSGLQLPQAAGTPTV
jgi:hypothetical protein